MKVTEVKYSMLRVTRQYENGRVEVVVQLDTDEDVQVALEKARKECDDALAAGRDASIRDKLKDLMSTPNGRVALERFLSGCNK